MAREYTIRSFWDWFRDVVLERPPKEKDDAMRERLEEAFNAGRETGHRDGYKEGLADASRALGRMAARR